jgi:hypothetical protein
VIQGSPEGDLREQVSTRGSSDSDLRAQKAIGGSSDSNLNDSGGNRLGRQAEWGNVGSS